ncbi:MAG: tetratricopeptide repeat protein, partial [Pirellulales bacterium]
AVALRVRGRNLEAQPLHEAALDSRRKLYPSEKFPNGHPDIASSLNNLATLLLDNGNPAAALDFYQQHLKMIEGFYPRDKFLPGHPDLANALTNIGQTHGELGNHTAARRSVERALEMWRALYPEGHPDIPRTHDVLGALLEQQGQLAVALQHYTEAYQIRERLFPPDDYPNGHVELTDSLARLTDVMVELNDFPQSKAYADRMLEMTRRLYPTADYPEGHFELALVLSKTSGVYSTMGRLLDAEDLLLESLAIRRHLYPPERHPRGHIMVARCLNNLALLYDSQGRHERARSYYERSLAMRRALFPVDPYPQGHADLARGLNNHGSFMESLGEFDAARRLHEESLAMRQRLYPPEKYPRGHRDLALSHHNLAIALQGRGRLDDAETHLRSEFRMLAQLYPLAEYENGHPRLAGCLNSLGSLMRAKGEWRQALELFEQALAMRRQIYSENGKTFDHARVAESLNNVANVCSDLGDDETAERLQRESVEMDRRLYTSGDYSLGHPSLAVGIANLGSLYVENGQPERGIPLQLEAVDMQYRLARAHVGGASEAESFNFVARHLAMPHGLLSAWDHAKQPDAELYRRVWLRKGMVHRVMAARNRALQAVRAADEDELYEQYLAARRGLARLILSPGSSDIKQRQDRLESLRVLSAEKERIERELAGRIPEFAEELAAQETSPDELAMRLPTGTVFVDLVVYLDSEYDPRQPGAEGTRRRWEIAAFVVARDQAVVRIPLGELAPVSERVTTWRRAIAETAAGRELEELRRQLWQPLERHFPAGTKTVVLCPDGVLTALPWAALPGRRPGSVLLEDYAIAFVPYGPFLLERPNIDRAADSVDDQGLFLAVGDVAYDTRPGGTASVDRIAQRDATVAAGTISWPALPGARDELDDVIAAAGDRQTVSLLRDDASTARTIEMLPSARGVHFATHGFFADARFRSALQLDERLFGQSIKGNERSSVAGRNPLALAGLVLAGANLPPKTDEFGLLQGEGGVLTGEVIAALPLGKMRLAVLSACETGIGEVAGGEGVFGLQRAFHIAGAQNVVASLWKVDDHATAALMRLFYHKLWTEKKTPLQALRESQLAIYRHPDQIKELSTSRGPNFNKVVKLVDRQPTEEKPKTAPTKLWASFVLSGFGS